jgi:tetratricopeptide (TPR) repeat protein
MVEQIMKTSIVIVTLLLSFSINVESQSVKVYHMTQDRNIERGMEALSNREFERASHYLWKAATSNQTAERKVSIYNNVCAVDYVLERYETAMDACNAALKLDRRNWRVLLNRANIYRDIGLFEKADNDYKKAMKIRPNEPMIMLAFNTMTELQKQSSISNIVAVNSVDKNK